jgi:hypothetical protein
VPPNHIPLFALCQPLTNIPLAQQFGIPGHKEAPMPPATIEAALLAVLDKNNHPMLIHCNKGKVSARRSFDAMMNFGIYCRWNSTELVVSSLACEGCKIGPWKIQ